MNAQSKIEAASLHSAMALAFAEIEGATKSTPGQVGQQKYKYADLTSVIEAIKPALVKHGLFFTQRPVPSENGITVSTMLYHSGGEWMELGSLFVPANKQDAQGFGSALTYARRYALVTAFGVPVEDDDGSAASRAPAKEPEPAAKQMPDAEWAKLVQLIEATSADTGAMLAFYKVKSLRELDQRSYSDCVAKLTEKLAKMAKEETNAKAAEKPNGFGEILEDSIPY